MNKQVKIDLDMLGVVAYMSNHTITSWLISVFDQIDENQVSDYLATRIMDMIPASERMALIAFVCGRCELTEKTKLRFFGYGLLYDNHVPEAVQRRCRLYEKVVFPE